MEIWLLHVQDTWKQLPLFECDWKTPFNDYFVLLKHEQMKKTDKDKYSVDSWNTLRSAKFAPEVWLTELRQRLFSRLGSYITIVHNQIEVYDMALLTNKFK